MSPTALRAFFAVPPADRRLFARALLLLPWLKLGLALLGFNRLAAALKRLSARAAGERRPAAGELARYGRAVERAARHLPGGATCLERSLLLLWMLRRAGLSCELRVGVRRGEDGALLAHAWLEHEGQPVGDHPEVAESYAPFDAPLA